MSESSLSDFKILSKLGEGTFSEVLKVESLIDGKRYAMKKFKKLYKNMNEVNACEEIKVLRFLNPHRNIVDLYQVLFEEQNGILCLTFELMECNLYELLSRKNFDITEPVAKEYTYQICVALDYIHRKGIFHRDVKPENILISNDQIKLADFGSCRNISSRPPYTEYIATRWYRSPECILAEGLYDFKMDIWAVGCVLFEMLTKDPLFPGADEFDQIIKIHEVLGTPDEDTINRMFDSQGIRPKFHFNNMKGRGLDVILPKTSRTCISLIKAFLVYDPKRRITASEALQHPFFTQKKNSSSGRRTKMTMNSKLFQTGPHIQTLDLSTKNNLPPVHQYSTKHKYPPSNFIPHQTHNLKEELGLPHIQQHPAHVQALLTTDFTKYSKKSYARKDSNATQKPLLLPKIQGQHALVHNKNSIRESNFQFPATENNGTHRKYRY